ncbi:hypothetical protein KPB05_33465, partial [Burkholderia gladioli]|uniref:hypothetical protein n=1 Tax=Burkholderia gladioli TaxID=28095 RepID=UPI0028674C73
GLFQNPDDLAFRESGRLHAKFPVDPAARKFYLEHPLILGGTTIQPGDSRPPRARVQLNAGSILPGEIDDDD